MEKDKVSEEILQLVTFKLGEEEFGVDILQVMEIVNLDQGITRVPKAPNFVEGVINLRGEIVPIVDLRKRFSLTLPSIGYNSRVIISQIAEGKSKVGMIVDSVVGVTRVSASAVEQAPSITKGVKEYYISGLVKFEDRLIVMLNLERALSADEVKELSEAKMG
jgi:purine-binding chemotaxis protein CheW